MSFVGRPIMHYSLLKTELDSRNEMYGKGNGKRRNGNCEHRGAQTYYKLKVKSPRILALSSISISRFASSVSFRPSWSSSEPFFFSAGSMR
jgi:Ni,Fe-hydrogenase I small subunit